MFSFDKLVFVLYRLQFLLTKHRGKQVGCFVLLKTQVSDRNAISTRDLLPSKSQHICNVILCRIYYNIYSHLNHSYINLFSYFECSCHLPHSNQFSHIVVENHFALHHRSLQVNTLKLFRLKLRMRKRPAFTITNILLRLLPSSLEAT